MKPQLITDMPAEEYHALDRLSASGIKLLAAGPLDYWYYTYGAGRHDKSTPAQMSGTAKHVACLEGVGAFQARYVPALSLDDYPGALVSQDDLKGWCRDHGLKVGGTKAQLCERIIEACKGIGESCPPLWLSITDAYAEAAEEHEQEILSQDDYSDILAKERQVESIIRPLRERGGIPEVTILWEQADIPCKARLDFLAPAVVVDLKNVANKYRSPFQDVCHKAIANDFLTIQAEWYLTAARVAAEAGLLPFEHEGPFAFEWLFLQSAGPENMLVRRYMQTAMSMDTGKRGETAASHLTRGIIGRALGLYREYQLSHGMTKPWVPPLDVGEISDIDYPTWFLMRDSW